MTKILFTIIEDCQPNVLESFCAVGFRYSLSVWLDLDGCKTQKIYEATGLTAIMICEAVKRSAEALLLQPHNAEHHTHDKQT